MLLATAQFVITTIQRKLLYFFVFFPKVPRSVELRADEIRAYESSCDSDEADLTLRAHRTPRKWNISIPPPNQMFIPI